MEKQIQANVVFTDDAYLKTRYLPREDGGYTIRVGRGGRRDILACKELYGKAVKTARELDCTACAFDLCAAAELGQEGLFAAVEGVCGGAYQKKFALDGRWEPELTCSFPGADAVQLKKAWELARSIMQTRNLVNCPSNLLWPNMFAQRLKDMAEGLPIEAELYDRQALERLGLRALLTVGDSSAHAPVMAVLRYTGAPGSRRRLGLVGKGVTVDSGGYCLKAASSMAGIKGDMAGGAAAAAAVRALAANGAAVNVTAVVPICENRISNASMLPGDVITSFSGKADDRSILRRIERFFAAPIIGTVQDVLFPEHIYAARSRAPTQKRLFRIDSQPFAVRGLEQCQFAVDAVYFIVPGLQPCRGIGIVCRIIHADLCEIRCVGRQYIRRFGFPWRFHRLRCW